MKNTFKLIFYNFKTLFYFELLYKLIIAVVFTPLSLLIFNLTMKLTGYSYLTLENIGGFLLNPITIIILILLLLFISIVTLFDISTMIVIFDESYHEYHINLKDALKISIIKTGKILRPKNILLMVFLLFIIPFLNVGITSGVITSIKIPEFIMDYINSNIVLFIIYTIVYLFLVLLSFRWIFVFNYMILEGKSFRNARKSSINLVYSKKTKCMLRIFSYQLLTILVFAISVLLIIALTYFLCNLIGKHLIIKSLVLTIIGILVTIVGFIIFILSNAITFAIISGSYYRYKFLLEEEIKPIDFKSIVKPKKKLSLRFKLFVLGIVLLIIGGLSTTIYLLVSGKYNPNIEFVKQMEVTAHRGASVKYPENTMIAFKGAYDMGADWIELDIQQTKDRKIVVSHDTNLKRVTGVNKNIIDMTYDEIKELDAGSFKDGEFAGERIPLLEDVLRFANDNPIRLNIELKPTGKEIDFEKDVVDLINKYNFKERCVLTSQVHDVLKNIKQYDSSIKTVYVMSLAVGDITKIEYADAFSVEASSVNESLVNKVHNSGKEIYAWTVNKESSISEMIDMGVDNIITDNIELAKEVIDSSNYSFIYQELIEFLRK